MPTVKQLSNQYVGRTGMYYVPVAHKNERDVTPLGVEVRVLDVRRAYGRIDLCIEPIAGTGKAWLAAHNVNLDEPGAKSPSAAARMAAYLKPK